MIEKMATGEAPEVRNGTLKVSDRPGIGLTIDESFLKSHLLKDEPWWG
jgi:L-alanine-DL-glutamate epimerase-like enolase superfamily enzyme